MVQIRYIFFHLLVYLASCFRTYVPSFPRPIFPYSECLKKLDLLKVWNVQVCDCYFDNQIRNIPPIYWSKNDIDDFNRRCRKHNQLVNFRMDPEV
jgi:hypothetical protein